MLKTVNSAIIKTKFPTFRTLFLIGIEAINMKMEISKRIIIPNVARRGNMGAANIAKKATYEVRKNNIEIRIVFRLWVLFSDFINLKYIKQNAK